MSLEIERKFLVLDESYKAQATSHSRMKQGYICSERGRTVRVRLTDGHGYLTIKAERHSDFENAEKKGSYLRCERSFGSYTRSFDVTGVDTTKVRAAYNNGVLAITLPKYVKPQPTAQTISID